MKLQFTQIGEATADELNAAWKSRYHSVDISEMELLKENQAGYNSEPRSVCNLFCSRFPDP